MSEEKPVALIPQVDPIHLLDKCIEKGIAPEQLGKLMDLAEKWKKDRAIEAYNASMCRCQSEMPSLVKDKDNSQTNSKYVKYETMNSLTKPVYTRHGFSLNWTEEPIERQGWVRIICDVRHAAGHCVRHQGEFPLDLAGIKGTVNKTAMHALGSAYSYARRYMEKFIWNLAEADEDNDGNALAEFPDTLIASEVDEIIHLIQDKGVDRAKFLRWAKVDEVEQILRSNFPKVLDGLRRFGKAAQKAGAK